MNRFVVIQRADDVGCDERQSVVERKSDLLDGLESILERSWPRRLRALNDGARRIGRVCCRRRWCGR
jgi:hypothetical protein